MSKTASLIQKESADCVSPVYYPDEAKLAANQAQQMSDDYGEYYDEEVENDSPNGEDDVQVKLDYDMSKFSEPMLDVVMEFCVYKIWKQRPKGSYLPTSESCL